VAVAFLGGAGAIGRAQQPVPAEKPAARADGLDALSQAELLKAYLRVQDELHATQLAIVNNRVEADAAARAQTAAVTEKLDVLRASLEAEREHQRIERQQAEVERERERNESARRGRALLWIAGVFGGVGLLAILVAPFLQARALNRFVERTRGLPMAPLESRTAFLPAGGLESAEKIVEQSNQRLLSVIDRMEQRIFELEHASAPAALKPPVAAHTAGGATNSGGHLPNASGVRREKTGGAASGMVSPLEASAEPADNIPLLLGRGRLLVEAGRSREALGCYDEILRLDAANAEALVRKGVALEHLKRDEDALACYDLAIRADRRKTLAYLCKGAVCSRLGRDAESVESYELALRTEEAGTL
jgi:tetratricopeptide (TPR) repeat protein